MTRVLAKAWWYVRAVMGETAYDTYLEHRERTHPGEPVLDRRAFEQGPHQAQRPLLLTPALPSALILQLWCQVPSWFIPVRVPPQLQDQRVLGCGVGVGPRGDRSASLLVLQGVAAYGPGQESAFPGLFHSQRERTSRR